MDGRHDQVFGVSDMPRDVKVVSLVVTRQFRGRSGRHVCATEVTQDLGLDPGPDVDRKQPRVRKRFELSAGFGGFVPFSGRWSNTKATQTYGLGKFEKADWAGNRPSRNCRVTGTMEPSWRDRYAVKQANRSKECGYRKSRRNDDIRGDVWVLDLPGGRELTGKCVGTC